MIKFWIKKGDTVLYLPDEYIHTGEITRTAEYVFTRLTNLNKDSRGDTLVLNPIDAYKARCAYLQRRLNHCWYAMKYNQQEQIQKVMDKIQKDL